MGVDWVAWMTLQLYREDGDFQCARFLLYGDNLSIMITDNDGFVSCGIIKHYPESRSRSVRVRYSTKPASMSVDGHC